MKLDVLTSLAAGASPTMRARINALRAHAVASAAPADQARVSKALAKRDAHRKQGRTAQRNGDAFEREVFVALDALTAAGVLAWWDHFGPQTKRLDAARVIVTGRAPCDVIGCTSDGRMLVAEVKSSNRRVCLGETTSRDARVEAHQRAQLKATHCAGGVALLIVEIDGERAVIRPDAIAMRGVTEVRVGTARQWSAGSDLAGAIRGAIEGSGER